MSFLGFFVPDEIVIQGTVVREEIIVPEGNKILGIGCHIIRGPTGGEFAVPNIRINLSRHLGKQIIYTSRKNPVLDGIDYRIWSSPGKPTVTPLYEEYEGNRT